MEIREEMTIEAQLGISKTKYPGTDAKITGGYYNAQTRANAVKIAEWFAKEADTLESILNKHLARAFEGYDEQKYRKAYMEFGRAAAVLIRIMENIKHNHKESEI